MKINNYLQQIQHNQVQSKQETLDGTNYSVFPVVMMTEGVHAGSGGPVLYTKDALSSFFQTWNGTPVTLGHPSLNGSPVSANHPEFYQTKVVGTVFNTHFEDGKLKAEVWLKDDKINALAPDLLNGLRTGMKLDVSTGLFDDGLREMGVFNGVDYQGVATNIRPDHLALLPGETGACSWAAGCGIRANKDTQKGSKQDEKEVKGMKRTTTPGTITKEEFDAEQKKKKEKHTTNQVFCFLENASKASYTEIVDLVRTKVNGLDIQGEKYHYARSVYPDYVVYQSESRMGGVTGLFKRNYSIKDGTVEWTSDPVSVQEEINYKEIKQNQEEENEMKTMRECCPLKVDELITANAKFKDTDKEMLLNLTEDSFARVIEMAEPTIKEVIKEVVKEVEVNVAPEASKTFEELLANADPKIRESVQHGQTLIARERANMVSRIKTNKSNVFTDAELEGFDLTMLGKLAELVPVPVNWMPVGGTRTITNAEEVPALPDTENAWEAEKK